MPPTQEPVNNVWSSTSPVSGNRSVTTPMGQTCVIRSIGIEEMIAAGILPEIDVLTPLIEAGPVNEGKTRMAGHNKKKAVVKKEEDDQFSNAVIKDPKLLSSIIGMADKVLPFVVVEPEVRLHYVIRNGEQTKLSAEEREAGIVYTDQIGLVDKMWLVEEGMGDLSSLAAFRDTATTALGSLES